MYYMGKDNRVYTDRTIKGIGIKFKCDELIANIISILNLKGYTTYKSSQGHFYDYDEDEDNCIVTYICFEPWVNADKLELPESFSYNRRRNMIYCTYNIKKWGLCNFDKNDAVIAFNDVQNYVIEVLYKWACKLPEYKIDKTCNSREYETKLVFDEINNSKAEDEFVDGFIYKTKNSFINAKYIIKLREKILDSLREYSLNLEYNDKYKYILIKQYYSFGDKIMTNLSKLDILEQNKCVREYIKDNSYFIF